MHRTPAYHPTQCLSTLATKANLLAVKRGVQGTGWEGCMDGSLPAWALSCTPLISSSSIVDYHKAQTYICIAFASNPTPTNQPPHTRSQLDMT